MYTDKEKDTFYTVGPFNSKEEANSFSEFLNMNNEDYNWINYVNPIENYQTTEMQEGHNRNKRKPVTVTKVTNLEFS